MSRRPSSAVSRDLQRLDQKKGISRTQRNTNVLVAKSQKVRPQTASSRNLITQQQKEQNFRKSYGGLALNQTINLMQTKSKTIWEAFGSYLAKTMRGGRGIWVPKFGIFTFSSMNVDLAGSTNPQIRDRQERFPVFVVGKDFVSTVPMRAGIAAGMNLDVYEDAADRGVKYKTNQIRIFNQQSVNGIIPKVKINYSEISTMTGGAASKDQCRDIIESIIFDLSLQVRRGQPVKCKIPNVGELIIKNSVAGVIFEQDLMEYSRGQTAKNFEFIFGGNNWMNNKIYKPNRGDYGEYAEDLNTNQAVLSPQQNLRVSHDALMWLKNNLDMDLQNMNGQNVKNLGSPEAVYKNNYIEQQIPQQQINNRYGESKTNVNSPEPRAQSRLRARPASASLYGRGSGFTRASSRQGSAVSRVPELAPFQLMNLATQIYSVRQSILDIIRNKMGSLSMRDTLSSSQIQRVLHQAGNRISIGNLKALLKELGFNHNGPSCSIKDLLQKLKEYVNLDMNYLIKNEYQTQELKTVERIAPADQVALLGMKVKDGTAKAVIEIIKELFYSTGKPLYQIFKEVSSGQSLDIDTFVSLIWQYSQGTMKEEEVRQAFESVCKTPYKDSMTYQEFEDGFKITVPTRGSLQNETVIIQKIREWMFQKQYASQGAFERLIRSVDRLSQKTFRRVDFHMAMIQNQVGLTAPEIDFLFDLLNPNGDQVSMDHWLSKIFDDALNPLQLIRELVFAEQMDATDVLFQMKLKVWDEPLTSTQFIQAIRRLDQSFSDSQCRALFNKLKNSDQKVDIQTLISNITGTENDTVDFKNKLFKNFYKDIIGKGNRKKLLNILEAHDDANDGKIHPEMLQVCLKKATGDAQSKYTDLDIQKFVRQLPRDDKNKVAYLEFLDRMCSLGDQNHNPLKSLIQRLRYFMESNKVNVNTLLTRLGGTETELLPANKFVDFLKAKVDKRRDIMDIYQFVVQMDIDNDGKISPLDLKTCLENANFHGFYDPSGNEITEGEISDQKIIAVLEDIRKVMRAQKILCVELFKKCDTENVGFINKAQFVKGIQATTKLATPLLEKLFLIMDTNRVGMVDYERFDKLIKAMVPSNIPQVAAVEDSFSWQEQIIQKIRDWIAERQLNAEDAFRQFDQDFDGLITKDDMVKSLTGLLRVRPEEINAQRIERLFRLLSFFKSLAIQPSDFERLVNDANPYVTAATNQTSGKFKASMGGSFALRSTTDWLFAAIQQIGLLISKQYPSIEASFEDVAGTSDKVDFESFMKFIDKYDALKGFSLTSDLKQKLFAEIDPHKKTYLAKKDWYNAFEVFNEGDHIMVELKNFMQSQFVDSKSAFEFLRSRSKSNEIDFACFAEASRLMLANRKLTLAQVRNMFTRISGGKTTFTASEFEVEFKNVQFSGKSLMTKAKIIRPVTAEDAETSASSHPASSSDWITSLRGSKTQRIIPKYSKPKNTADTHASKWEMDVLDKLKRLIKSSGKSLEAIFKQIDTDGSGAVSSEEFHRALKMISLGLTKMEIQKIMNRVDSNNDGTISYLEFAAKFREDPVFEEQMVLRANQRLVEINELMILHMDSAFNAYRMFDTSRGGRMSLIDFDQLIHQLMRLANKSMLSYVVVKDMFDALDRNHDQVIDPKEWHLAFGGLKVTKLSKTKSTKKELRQWGESHQANLISQLIARNSDSLTKSFRTYSTHSDHQGESRFVTLAQAKKALEPLIIQNFTVKGIEITDEQLHTILKVGLIGRSGIMIYDFTKVLDIYKKREQDAQFLG